MKNEKGAALITTIILGIVALAVIAALLTFILYGLRTSTLERKYTSALEAAKGSSEYIMKSLLDDTLNCKNSNGDSCKCSSLTDDLKCPNCSNQNSCKATIIDLGSFSKVGDYEITATLLSKSKSPNGSNIYAIRVEAKKISSSEKAEIDFVFKVE